VSKADHNCESEFVIRVRQVIQLVPLSTIKTYICCNDACLFQRHRNIIGLNFIIKVIDETPNFYGKSDDPVPLIFLIPESRNVGGSSSHVSELDV
jgi:hypothetical protein